MLREHPKVSLPAPAVYGPVGEREYLCRRPPSVWVLFLRGFAPAGMKQRNSAALDDHEMRDAIGNPWVEGIPLASGCFLLARTAALKRVGGVAPRKSLVPARKE